MKKSIVILFISSLLCLGCSPKKEKKDSTPVDNTKLTISPISHATAVLTYGETTIYIDPTGGKAAFSKFKTPDLVFITDIHGDHMNIKTLTALDLSKSTLVAPAAVVKNLPEGIAQNVVTMANGEVKSFNTIQVEAIPMYNLREEALKFHNKGRGNGYVITIADERIYFSGDTEDIPEMRALKNIDKAFVCMNLPYTMTVESAASAVLEFAPKMVYPYHYRGTNGMSDVAKFKQLVEEGNPAIKVNQLNWYPKN